MTTPATEADLFSHKLIAAAQPLGVTLSLEICQRMHQHYAMLLTANQQMNLTRITALDDAVVKHYADSLALIPWLKAKKFTGCGALDVGTGAGFPALPLAIALPKLHMTAIDSTRKKIDFLYEVASTLKLRNLHVRHERAEHWDVSPFDLVMLRAVSLQDGIAKASHLVRRDGYMVFYRAGEPDPQATKAADISSAMQQRHLTFDAFVPYQLVLGEESMSRHLLILRRK